MAGMSGLYVRRHAAFMRNSTYVIFGAMEEEETKQHVASIAVRAWSETAKRHTVYVQWGKCTLTWAYASEPGHIGTALRRLIDTERFEIDPTNREPMQALFKAALRWTGGKTWVGSLREAGFEVIETL